LNWLATPLTIDYILAMYKVLQTEAFEKWLDGLRDAPSRRRLALRIRKASLGTWATSRL
jgi:putative component of toxin-antitoxin plasmid stabilization module